jgi:hypothetical protein
MTLYATPKANPDNDPVTAYRIVEKNICEKIPGIHSARGKLRFTVKPKSGARNPNGTVNLGVPLTASRVSITKPTAA